MTSTNPGVAAALGSFEQLDIKALARDIARSAYEDVIGPHAQSHRKDI